MEKTHSQPAEPSPSPDGSATSQPSVVDSRNPEADEKVATGSPSQPSPLNGRTSVLPTVSPTQEPARQVDTVSTRPVDNDVGKSKTNAYYEVTVENAWISSAPVRLDICSFNVSSGQKAILVRFAIRRSSLPRTNEEMLRLGYTQTTDFVLLDDQNRRLDPECQVNGIVLGEDRPVTRTLAYLVPAGSQHVSFRSQKSGGGQPIVFDLSGLN